jgi:NADPH-dependent 2,4-dienoyl-CoA reductase/sulfur reductase-like enzyme
VQQVAKPGTIVIVGAGLAGATAAAGLRTRGHSGPVVLFGAQSHRPYELPPLSKGILLGDTDEPDWVRDADFYATNDIDFRPGTTIEDVRPADRVVIDASGATQSFDRLLLATGLRPRTLPVTGGQLAGVHTLRTLDDSLALRSRLTPGTRVVIVGGGWIGCEVAAAARRHGAAVTVVEPLPLPLLRVLGSTVAGVFRDLHEANGVRWKLGVGVQGLAGAGDGGAGDTVRSVRLDDGTDLPADLVVVAIGAAPRVELAERIGLALADRPVGGVAVDAALRTSAPDVYAAGDIAAQAHPRYERRVRVEHWANAKDQGEHVAGSLLGADEPYARSPYFFSDQYDLGMEYRGLADPERDELVVRGDLAAREFIAFWLRDGRVQAAMNVNSWDDGDTLQSLVDNQAAVDATALTNGDLPSLVA